ncbi:MAG: hypothetical protein ACREM2_04910 [Vulcanimicrobiaceae bacterium]
MTPAFCAAAILTACGGNPSAPPSASRPTLPSFAGAFVESTTGPLAAAGSTIPLPLKDGYGATFSFGANDAPAGTNMTISLYSGGLNNVTPDAEVRKLSASSGSPSSVSGEVTLPGFLKGEIETVAVFGVTIPQPTPTSGNYKFELFVLTLEEIEESEGASTGAGPNLGSCLAGGPAVPLGDPCFSADAVSYAPATGGGTFISFPASPKITFDAGNEYFYEILYYPNAPNPNVSPTPSPSPSVSPTPSPSPPAGPYAINAPAGLAFDSSGDLYVANQGANEILIYSGSPLAQQTAKTITADIGNPGRLVIDNGYGILYVAGISSGQVTAYNLSTGAEIAVDKLTSANLYPLGLAVDPNHYLFIGSNNATEPGIAVYSTTASGAPTLVAQVNHDSTGRTILPGALGILPASSADGNQELVIVGQASSSENALIAYPAAEIIAGTAPTPVYVVEGSGSNNLAEITGIAVTSTNLFVSNFPTPVDELNFNDPPAVVQRFASGLESANGVAIDTSGNVWVSDATGDAVDEFAPGGGSPIGTLSSARAGSLRVLRRTQ